MIGQETYMRGYLSRCGHMARMFTLGKSKEGRPMWALELSNNAGSIEAKPNARLVGNMHGDEPASRYLQAAAPFYTRSLLAAHNLF